MKPPERRSISLCPSGCEFQKQLQRGKGDQIPPSGNKKSLFLNVLGGGGTGIVFVPAVDAAYMQANPGVARGDSLLPTQVSDLNTWQLGENRNWRGRQNFSAIHSRQNYGNTQCVGTQPGHDPHQGTSGMAQGYIMGAGPSLYAHGNAGQDGAKIFTKGQKSRETAMLAGGAMHLDAKKIGTMAMHETMGEVRPSCMNRPRTSPWPGEAMAKKQKSGLWPNSGAISSASTREARALQ